MVRFIPRSTVTSAGNVPTSLYRQQHRSNMLLLRYKICKKYTDGAKELQNIFQNGWTLSIKYPLSPIYLTFMDNKYPLPLKGSTKDSPSAKPSTLLTYWSLNRYYAHLKQAAALFPGDFLSSQGAGFSPIIEMIHAEGAHFFSSWWDTD